MSDRPDLGHLGWLIRETFTDAACHCPCHEMPGVYPTSPARPCGVCGHVDADGELGAFRRGWRPRLEARR